jgi:hypothetical protein
MNRDLLTVLGCTSSLALALAIQPSALTNPLPAQYQGYVGIDGVLIQPDHLQSQDSLSASTPSQADTELITVDSDLDPDFDSDLVGDMAVDQFGCDCPPCRVAVVQMLQTGSRSI